MRKLQLGTADSKQFQIQDHWLASPHIFATFMRGWLIFRDEGISVVKCSRCGDVIQFSKAKSGNVTFACPCSQVRGSFPETLSDDDKALVLRRLAQKIPRKTELFPNRGV